MTAVYIYLVLTQLYLPRESSAASVDNLVENPPLIKISAGDGWNYESEFFLTNTYGAIRQGDYTSARAFGRMFLEQRPDDPDALWLLIHITMNMGAWDEAEGCLARLTALQPDNVPAKVSLGFVHSRLRLYNRAAMEFQDILDSNPSPQLKDYLEKSIASARNKAGDAAKKSSGQWRKLKPLVEAIDNAPLSDQQAASLESFLRRWPEQPEALMVRGRNTLKGKRAAAAQKDFFSVLTNTQESEQQAPALAGLATAEKQLWSNPGGVLAGRSSQAVPPHTLEKCIARLLAENPDSPELLFLRGSARLAQGGELKGPAQADLEAALKASAEADDTIFIENLLAAARAEAL